jgi:hypothetical protein
MNPFVNALKINELELFNFKNSCSVYFRRNFRRLCKLLY